MEKIVDVQPGLNILKNFLRRSLVEIFIRKDANREI